MVQKVSSLCLLAHKMSNQTKWTDFLDHLVCSVDDERIVTPSIKETEKERHAERCFRCSRSMAAAAVNDGLSSVSTIPTHFSRLIHAEMA